MVANSLPTETPLCQGVGSKGHTIYFCENSHVAYIKLKGIEHRARQKQLCCHYTHQRPPGLGSKGHIFCFKKWSCGYQIKLEEV